ncbi:MAG TPA: hypothetical protein DCW90_17885 [Lachnospiraceae bacterium]|nr:hypothetical protein [Lachnospiraceae bacterium]
MYITLRCNECENTDCKLYPCGKWLDTDGQYGCTRNISDDDYAQYIHLTEDIAPFMYMKTTREYKNKAYQNLIGFYNYLYSCPVGQKLNRNGKIISQ